MEWTVPERFESISQLSTLCWNFYEIDVESERESVSFFLFFRFVLSLLVLLLAALLAQRMTFNCHVQMMCECVNCICV